MIAKRTPSQGRSACTEQVYEVRWEDLPLSCPTPDMKLWNAHPRVYLSIHQSGEAMCEYCGARYRLLPPDPDAPIPNFDNTEIEDAYKRALAELRDGT